MQEYNGEQIEVLKGLEAVRKRPGMYIGNTAERGLHQLVYEAVDNSVDEALAGYATEIKVVALQGRLGLGRGQRARDSRSTFIAEEELPAVEVAMTILHAGGKFGKGGYKVSGGLHGVGISVVNALSEKHDHSRQARRLSVRDRVRARRSRRKKLQAHRPRRRDRHLSVVQARPEVFETLDFSWSILEKRLRELAFLNRGLAITLRDERVETAAKSKTLRSTRAGSSRSSSGSMRTRKR